MLDPDCEAPWSVAAELAPVGGPDDLALSAHTAADRPLALGDLLDTRAVSALDVSPDGRLVAITWRQPEVPSPHSRSWVDVVERATGAIVASTEGSGSLAGFAWLPAAAPAQSADGAPRAERPPGGAEFSFVTRDGEKATLWRAAVGGPRRAVLDGIEGFGAYRWLPDGRAVVYSVEDSPDDDDDDRGAKRMRDLPDRWPGFRDVHQLELATIAPADGGFAATRRRLTRGAEDKSLADVHPRGSHVLFTTTRYGLTTRPFSETVLWELDLATLDARRVVATPTLNDVEYAPDGETLVLLAGGSFAAATHPTGEEGEGGERATVIPNDYDVQVYLVEQASGTVTPLTADFRPSILQAELCAADGAIYVRAEEGFFVRLYRIEPRTRKIERVDVDVPDVPDVIDSLSVAEHAHVIAYAGSSPFRPERVFGRGPDGKTTLLADPWRDVLPRIRRGAVEEWTWTSPSSDAIEGLVYWPPGFDPARGEKIPLIVYYYGGTSPTSRAFAGRYPKELWAARGYAVFTLNPSGATGYGEEFSARHVNDWGRTTAHEIIGATQAFLDAHPSVDRERVGCIGASYGGFMTMLLITHTDLFAAAVSHAGISSIASYWGEGFWGYLYSAVATADSFPWNRTDLYVEQSPLFRADKITTPLLLLHGEEDTNVPIGESEQMYTALRILGKEVEFVRFAGEDHRIMDRDRRELWSDTISAWFDARLKGRAGWWDHLWE